ncbi:GNAT family N-acetyltransferase [Streptomyces kaniharaensis]|uniref:GNAT family N-acetyltransferase n=1 Tax=Streptomyces kaniharaensis TaxID=212423 RepID=UPI0018A7FBC4|nr:GNAT family N-acetyltransferase [Streptomyces kaniharaensis]
MNLRELTTDDAHAVRRIYSGASVRHLGRDEMGRVEAHRYVGQAIQWAQEDQRVQHILGINVDGDLLGIVKLNTTTAEGRLSYILREDAWGHGHATTAVIELLAFAFDTLHLTTITAKHRAANPASGRVLVKAGFTRIRAADGLLHYAARPGRRPRRPRLAPRPTPAAEAVGEVEA